MSNTIILKKSSVVGKVPLAGDLQVGELAVNLADAKLYSKNAGGTVIEVGGASTVPVTSVNGKTGAVVLDVADISGALDKNGDAMTGTLELAASTSSLVPLKIAHGSNPSSLSNGDFWTTTASLIGRINGSTRTFIHNGNPTSLASDISQAEAEAGTVTTRRWFSALRVRQAIEAWWASVVNASAQAFNTANINGTTTPTAISFGNTAFNTDTNWASGAATRLTINSAGVYSVSFTGLVTFTTETYVLTFSLRRNGTEVRQFVFRENWRWFNGDTFTVQLNEHISLAANDFLEIFHSGDSTGYSIGTAAATRAQFTIVKVA